MSRLQCFSWYISLPVFNQLWSPTKPLHSIFRLKWRICPFTKHSILPLCVCVIVWFIYWIFNSFYFHPVASVRGARWLRAITLQASWSAKKTPLGKQARELLTNDYLHFVSRVHWQVDWGSRCVKWVENGICKVRRWETRWTFNGDNFYP